MSIRCLLLFPYPLYASGSGILLQGLARSLIECGCVVRIVSVECSLPVQGLPPGCDWSGMILGRDFPLGKVPIYTGIAAPCITFGELTANEYAAYRDSLQKLWKKNVREFSPDVVVCSHLWTHAAILQDLGVRVDVVLAHGTDLIALKRDPEFEPEVRRACAWSRHVVVASSFVEQQVRRMKLFDDKSMTRIPPGVRSADFQPLLRECRHPSTVLHVPGKFVNFKGTDRLLQAASIYERRNAEIRTTICASGPVPETLRRLALELGLERVDWRSGWFGRREIDALLAEAGLLVVPSRCEPFGMIAAEALTCGTPVVGDDSGGLRDIVGEGDGRLVDADQAELLAEAILQVALKSESPATCGNRSARAMERYSWQNIGAQWLRLLESLSH